MKLRLLAAMLSLCATAVFAQDVDVDVNAPDTTTQIDVPGMSVKMRVGGTRMQEGPAPQPARALRPPPPVQVMGVDTFDLRFELKPQETLRLLSPEGAHADLWADDGSYVGGFEVPCEVAARPGQFYRVVMTMNGGLIFDRKVELRPYYRTNVSWRGAPRAAVMVAQPSMGMTDFPALVEAVKAESFSDAKLDVVRTSEGGLTVDQLGQLVDLFSFAADQVKLVEVVNPRLVDRQNAFKLYGHFTFDADKKKVKAILGK